MLTGRNLSRVMPGLVPGIHAAPLRGPCSMAQCPGVDGRDKPSHDE